jgi:hypothetical protein
LNEETPIKKKGSKALMIILLCAFGLADAGWDWHRKNVVMAAMDLVVWPMIIVWITTKKPN